MIRKKIKEIGNNAEKFKFVNKAGWKEWVQYKNVRVCLDEQLFWVVVRKRKFFKIINNYIEKVSNHERKFLLKAFEKQTKEIKEREIQKDKELLNSIKF